MTPDIALIKHTLTILRHIGGPGLEERALMTELEIAACRPLTTAQARDTLLYCTDRGWTATRRDDFDRTIHWLTESGITRLAGL